MICNQFPPFEDEHLYSWLVRLYHLSGYPSFLAFQESLGINTRFLNSQKIFNNCTSRCLTLLNGKNINQLLTHAPLSLWQITVPNLATRQLGLIKNQLEKSQHMYEPRMFNFETSWKSCPQCRQEGANRYGVTYWHLHHQLPSVFECTKHGNMLEYASQKLQNIYNGMLPQNIDNWLPCLKSVSDSLRKWQNFYLDLHNKCNVSADYAMHIRNELVNYLGLKGKSQPERKRICQQLNPHFEEALGSVLLSYLFRDYVRNNRRGTVNILACTFASQYKSRGKRNPIYWVAVLYWLKDEINLTMEV